MCCCAINGITELLLVGYALHVCVESTLREAHDRGYLPLLIEDACAAFTATQREHVLQEVMHNFGHSITTEGFCQMKKQTIRYNSVSE